jgi:outer membrane protein OmpA-like peptidoglycan-associated protein
MDITTAPLSLVDLTKRALTPELLARTAAQLGESPASVQGALAGLLPSILGATAARSGDTGFMQRLAGMIGDPAHAAGFLASLFGDRTGDIATAASRATGIKPGSASSLLALAGPMALGLLRDAMREEDVAPSGLGRWLGAQAPALKAATPAWFTDALATRPAAPAPVPGIRTTRSPVGVPPASRAEAPRSKWPLYLAGAVAAIGLLWLLGRGGREPDTRVEPTVVGTPTVTAPAGPTVTRTLPTGAALEYPANGLEASLLGAVDARTTGGWVDFDRLRFATDETTLDPASRAQLQNVARILEAYPDARVEIGGFTDDVGSPGDNRALSQKRAESVASALAGMGVDRGRMTARGYGEAQPVASNDTEAGRARNRRVSLRLTDL